MALTFTATINAVTKVTQLYVAMFGRAPDIEGLNFWGGALDAGQSVAKIAQDMFATTPARAYFPTGSTNTEIIQAFYVNVLGRQPDTEGLAFWVARLDALNATGNVNAVGQVVTEIISIVVNYQGNTPEGAESARLFANKIEVANFWVTENGGAENATKPITLVTADPASVNQVKVQILNNFSDGTITLKEAMVDGSLQPIRLTTEGSNAGTSATTAGDDTIVAGRLELLHQAYIDGGQGRNVLEIDAKGVYAQPAALLNIQEVRVHNLPNVYTTAGNGATGYLNNSSYPQLASNLAAASEVIPASAFNKLVITANQLKLTVDGQAHTVPAGIYTAESLAQAINAAAGSVVAVVNAAGISIDGAAMTFRGNAAGQISAAEFNSVVINDLQLQVVNGGVETGPAVIPAGVYTAVTLADAINDLVPGDVAVVDAAASAAAVLVENANDARADLAAAQLSLIAAEARDAAAEAQDDYTDARAAEANAHVGAADASQDVEVANTHLALANAAVTAANAQTAAQAANNSATAAVTSATARTAAANTAADTKATAATTSLTAAQGQVTTAKDALDIVIGQITTQISGASTALLDSAEAAVTQATTTAATAQTNFGALSLTLDALLALSTSTPAQIQAAQTALAQAQEALAQANADLTSAMQSRTEVALTIAKGLVDVNVDHLGLPVLQNEYAKAQGVATQAGVAVVAAQAAQAATLAAGVSEVAAATAAQTAATAALGTATTAATTALTAAQTAVGSTENAAGVLAEAQADAITAEAALIAANAAVTAATTAVTAAFTALTAAQTAADAANQAAARELAQAGSTDDQVSAALTGSVQDAQAAVAAAQALLVAAETALASATAGNLFGGSGSVVITANGTAQEIRFYGDQALAFGLGDIAQDGTLTIPARLTNSVIDLSRATALDRLVITESAGTQVATAGALALGDLTVVGVRNGAVLRLEGSFTQTVNIEYSAGMSSTEPLKLELVLGDVAETALLNLVHNTSALHIDSLGGGANRLDNVDLGQGTLSKLIVSGNAGFYVAGDLKGSFSNDVAIIDASANTVGVSLVLSGTRTVEVTGTRGNDYFKIGAKDLSNSTYDAESVVILDTTGNNTYVVDSFDATITTGDGNNVFLVDAGNKALITAGNGANRVSVDSGGDATVIAGDGNANVRVDSAADAQVTLGSGKHEVNVFADARAQVAIGAGDSRVSVAAGESYLTTGNGNNRVTVTALEGNAEVVAGDGNSQYVVTAIEGHAHVTAGDGNNTFNLTADEGVQLTTGNGANQIVVDGNTTGDVTIVAGNGNSGVIVDTDKNIGVTAGSGNSSFDLASSTGGVNLSVGAGNQTVSIDATTIVVNGGATGNGTYKLSGKDATDADDLAASITLTLGAGNNVADIYAQLATINAANGDNNLSVVANVLNATVGNGNSNIDVTGSGVAAKATITAGNGDTDITVRTVLNATVTSGDGESAITVTATGKASVTSGNGDKTVEINSADAAQVVLGDGNNNVNTDDIVVVSITVGDGKNDISSVRGESVTVVAGDGGNNVTVSADVINVTTGSGNDTIVVSGMLGDIDIIDITGDGNTTGLLNINVGAGQNTVVLGRDVSVLGPDLQFGITALEGSSITGENITLRVENHSDLRAAELSGIERVVLNYDLANPVAQQPGNHTLTPVLTLTDTQFLAIGAANFAVQGAIFNNYAQVKIIVTQTTSLTALGVDSLPRNIDLQLEVQDGVTLTMTAQQLHTKVAPGGVTLPVGFNDDQNTDLGNGKVVITGGGDNFDPFNTSDRAKTIIGGNTYYGGSLSTDFAVDSDNSGTAGDSKSEWYNVTVKGGYGGYNRPADVPVEEVWTIDGNEFPSVGAHSTWNYNIEIIGSNDVVFTGAGSYGIELGANKTPFVIDFSQLDGEAIGLTLGNFENVGAVYGNSDNGYTAVVNVELDNTTDTTAGDPNGLVSSGVSKYVVTKIGKDGGTANAGISATIVLGDTTQDLEVLALRGNYNDTLVVQNAIPGVTFELQGGPASGNGPNGTANVGKLDVTYEFDTPDAVVNLAHSVTGDTRAINVLGIEINNADAITINAGTANAIIGSIAGSSLDDLVLVGDRNVSVTEALSLTTGLDSIDASAVDGNLTLSLSGIATDSGFDFVASAGTSNLSLSGVTAGTHSSFVAETAAVFNVFASGTNDLSKATLTNVDTLSLGKVSVNEQGVTVRTDGTVTLSATQAIDIGLADIKLTHPGLAGTLNLVNLGSQAFDAADLGAGVNLGTVTIAAGAVILNAATVLTGATVTVAKGSTLTLTADQYMALDGLTGVDMGATIHITGLTQAHIDAGFTLDGVDVNNATGTISLAENVNLAALTDLNGFSVVLAAGQTLGVATAAQADGLVVNGAADTTIKLLFSSLDNVASIDVDGFNVDTLLFQDLLVVNGNTDGIFAGLLPRVEKVMYNIAVQLVDQTVTVSAGAFVRGNLSYDLPGNVELEDFVLNLEGGTQINGNIDLGVAPKSLDLIQTYLKTVTINSTGTTANPQTGKMANIIQGQLTAGVEGTNQNELLDVTINATQNLSMAGVNFSAVVNNDEVATLTVSGTADVNIGTLSTADDDVDGLTVTNNGTGVLTLTLDGDQLDQTIGATIAATNNDALRFVGTGRINLVIDGTVNLSDDVITAVGLITLKNGATVQLTADQVRTLGEASIVRENADASATLIVSDLSTQPFDSTAVPDGIDITVVMAAGNIVLDAATNLRDITTLTVNSGTTLTMTATQATQLVNEALTTVTGTAPNLVTSYFPITFNTTTTTGGTINVTGIGQSHLDAGLAAVLQGMGGSGAAPGAPFMRGTIEIVEDVKLDASTLNAAAVSGFRIVGNGAEDLRVNVTMDALNVGTDPSGDITDALLGLSGVLDAAANVIGLNSATGVKSTGISTYVVTALSAQTDVFYVCNDTVGLTTLGLQGNGGDTIYFGGVKRGVTFLLEGDGKASWSDVEKVDLDPDFTEIGGLTAAFFTGNNPSATVVINNQGVALGASSTGGERAITTGAITINNALAIDLQVQDGDAVVAAVAGQQVTTLKLTAVEDLFITAALPNLDTINATAVAGLFKATISDNDFALVTGADADITLTDSNLLSTASIDGTAGTLNLNIGTTSDLSAGTLISVETLTIASGQSVTLSAAQVAAIGEADISGVAGGSNETLSINGLTDAITINEALLGTGVVLGTVTMAAGDHTLSAGTDLTGASLVVPAGGTLTLTADQYMALADLDGIAPTGTQTAAVIHITGLTQAHIDAGFTLANVSNVNFALSDVALDPAAATVNLGSTTNLNGFGVDLSANQTLGIANSTQADGLRIAGDSTNTVVFRFDALDGATVSGDSRIDASKYSIGTLRAMDAFFTDPSALNGEENAEFVIQGLSGDVTLVVYTDPTLLGITGYNRTVIIEAGVTVPAEFVFNDTGAARELIDLTITLQGDATVNGDLRLPTAHANGSGARFFDDLVINSTGAASAGGNRILGDITPVPELSGDQNPTSTTERENNLLKVTIGGDKALTITGDIVFNKVGDDSAATTADNGAATLTVTSTAAVTVGALDTSDNDVTSLTVSNTGGATLSVTIDAAKIDATDALSFTGGDIALTVVGVVDLSNDNLEGVDSVSIGDGATLTLSQAQFDALGAANIIDGGATGSAILNINGVNAAFDATTIDADIDVQTLTLAGSMDFAATASNLSGVDSIVVPAGATLTLTAAQFQQLKGAGTISATGATVNITGLTQADIDSGAFDTSGITAGTITLSLAANVNLSADDVIENVTSVILADGQTLGLATSTQADDLNVAGGVNTTIVFQFFPMIGFPGQINAAGYDVTTLKALAAGFTSGGNSNVEYSIDDLPSSVELRLYADPEQLGFLNPSFRKVVIEAGVTTPTGLVFNDWDTDDYVNTLSLTLEGGARLNGSLSIPTRTNKTADAEPMYFSQLTIVSEGAQPNVIGGNINTATVLVGPNTSENNLLSVTISGTQALNITGDIVFNKVDDNAVGGDDATAVLNVNSSAAVTVGALNTQDDDVTGLTVNNTGTGTLNLTIDAGKIDAADALSFTGDNIALTVVGAVDLANDNLAGVNSIVISDNSTLTVTQAQFDALGAANFGTDGSPVVVNLVITEFGSDPFDATDLAAGINVASIVLAASPAVITLDPATNLTGVDKIVVPEGSTLRLTAAQFQQLQGSGTIEGADGADANSTVDAFNVEIYDVRQANVAVDTDNDGVIDAGDQVLDLGLVGNTAAVTLQLAADVASVTFGSFTSTGVSASAFASDLFVGTSGNLASIEMGNNQSVVFVSAAQADGIRVTGGTNSSIAFAFDDSGVNEASTGGGLSVSGNGIDASLYNVTNLRALNVFVDGRNVEQVVENLSGNVTLVVYQNPEDIAIGFRSAVNRTVIIEPTVFIDDFVAFIDLNTAREIRNLTIEMQGGTAIDGDVRLATMPTASATTQPRYFDTLTIASTGTAGNRIGGDITAQPAAATPSQIGSVENNLLKVVVAGTQDLVITGDIVFSKVGDGAVGGGDDATANLTITNTGTTTIEQLDVSDNDLSGLTIVNNGGQLTVTGASPALLDNSSVGATGNLETLTLSGTGNITFGLNPNVTTETGLDLGNVSTINASALSGNLNLGEVTNIDSANFSFIAGTGVTTLTLTSDTLLETAPLTDTGWSFDFANAAAGSAFHLGSSAASSLVFDNGGVGKAGSLSINLGSNTTLYIDENTDLTDLDLLITQGTAPDIVLADGVTLTLTALQASGLRIVAGPDTAGPGITAKVQIVDLGNIAVDLSGIAANIAGTILLEDNDVTLDAATHLGSFSVTLNALNNTDLSGQTIRFQTVEQAERTIIANDVAGPGANSTNVVWLFESVTAPVNTNNYDGDIGRLWMTQSLLNGANVEQLFTSLPTTIVRSEFTTITQLDGFLSPSQPVDRIVELVAFTNLPGGMVFNDTDALEGVQSLTLNLGGQVTTGNISIDDAVAVGTDPTTVLFNELTINSYRALHQDHVLAPEAYVNNNDGTNEVGEFVQPQNINTVGNIRVVGVAGSGIDLLTVNLNTRDVSQVGVVNVTGNNANAGANLVVGTITFDAAATSSGVAALNVTGANNTTVAALDATDGDIDTLAITNSGSGNLVITGASPAASLGSNPAVTNVETLVINATSTGSVTLGTALDATKPGVSGDDLSLIDVNGSGNVNLGVIALVDGNDFTLDAVSSTGKVTAVFDGTALNANGEWTIKGNSTPFADPDEDGLDAPWVILNSMLAVTIKDTVTLGAGTLTITGAVVTISGNVDFTTLHDLDVNANTVVFVVTAGSSLTILAEDAHDLIVTGAGVVHVHGLEATPTADLSNIMTSVGDTGTVFATVDTTDDADVDLLPETVNLTGNLGIAQVTVLGGGLVDATDAEMDATFDRGPVVGNGTELVKTTFVVQAATTLVLEAQQGDDRSVTGAGTTNIEDIGVYAGGADMSLAGVVTTTVNIAVDTDVTLDRFDNLGAAGAGRVTTIGATATLTAAGSVVNGQYITSNQATAAGTNAKLIVDDEGTLPVETPITANLSHVSVEFIELAPTAQVGTITFPVLYGDPVAKYGDLLALPPVAANPNVAVQTVTLTAVQASGQTIDGAGAGAQGEVVVNDLDGAFTNLSLINAGLMTAHVADTPVVLHAGTDLGEFDVVIEATAGQLTLTAGQADGIQITESGAADATVTVTALASTPNADLSQIAVFDEVALLDANGGVNLGANLGANMEVIVSDSVVGGPNTVTFTGEMVSADTTFTIAANAITLVFDANDAHELTVAETGAGVLNSAVTVNNVDGGEMDLSGITADTLIANVPADAVMHAGSNFGSFNVVLAEGADLTLSFAQFLNVGVNDAALDAVDFSSEAGGVEEIITVTGWTPATALDTSVLPPSLALVLQIDPALAATPPAMNTVTVAAGTNLSGVEEIVIPAGVTLNMTADQFQQIQHSVTVTGAGTLNITNLDSDNADIDLSSVTAVAGTISLESSLADAAGVATKFTLDASLTDGDVSVTIDGVLYSVPFATSHGQTLANFKTALNASGDFAAMVEGNTVTIRPKDPTVSYVINTPFATTDTLAAASTTQSVYVVLDAAAVLDNATGSKFSVVYTANNQSLTLASEVQADGRTISENGHTGNVLVLGFTDADDVVDTNPVIVASGFTVDHVWVLNDYLFKEFGIDGVPANFEFFLEGLKTGIPVTVYDTNTLLQANLLSPGSLVAIDRTVTVDQETTIQASVAFNVLSGAAEVRSLTLNLEGNSVIVGNLQLPQDKDPNADLNNPVPADDSLPLFFNTLTINSTNESGLLTAPNRITGSIFADDGSDGAGSESHAERFVLTLNPAMSITGNEGLISFDGAVLALQNGWTDDNVAAALAGLAYNNWTATDTSTAESTTFTVGALTAGQTVTIAGRTVTAIGAVTAAEVATAFQSGASVALLLNVSGALAAPAGWTGVPAVAANGVTVTFTNTVTGDATNFTASTGTNPATGVATNGVSQVEFLNKNAGVVDNAVIGDFTFVANNGSTVGLTGTVATTAEGLFAAHENNLYTVVINATHDLIIDGELELRYLTRSNGAHDETVTGTITINGNANVTIGSVNSDDIHVTGVTLTNNGTGTVSAPGTSPGAAVSNTEVLTINVVDAAGVVNLGTAGDASKPGVSGADLSLIEVTGEGDANLGVIALVDSMDFDLDAIGNSGDVTATIGATLAAGGVWSFANGATGTLNLTINEDASFAAGSTLSIQGATITIDGDVDLSGVDLSGVVNDCEFFVPAGSVLTLNVAQVLEFGVDSIAVTGGGTVKVIGDATNAHSTELGLMLQTVNVDLSGVTLNLVVDLDDVLEFQNAGAFDDLGASVAQNIIGSANDDLFLLSNSNDTVTGGLGNDTYGDGSGMGYYTYNVDAGTDTIASLYSDVGGNDVLVVSTGATANAANITEFVATAATVNNGTANLSTDAAGGEIDVSAAGGTGRFYLNGGADVDVLVGGAGSDVINGGLNGLGHDVLTGGLGADFFVFNIVQNNPTTPTVTYTGAGTSVGTDREQITFTGATADNTTSVTIAYRINGSTTVPGTVVDIAAVDSMSATAVAAVVGIHLAGVFGSNATVSVNAGVVTLQGANGVAIEIVSVTPNLGGDLVGTPAEAMVLDTPQTTLVTIPAGTTPMTGDYVVGDILSFTFSFAEGTGTGTVNYTVNAGDGVTQADVTNGVAAAINANWDAQLDTTVVGNVISVTSTVAGADSGGFTVTAGAVGGVSATGASALNPASFTSVDVITDFVSGTDKIVLSVSGTGVNFESGVAMAADFTAAKTAAETAFADPGVRYFFTAVEAGATDNGVLFFDLNGDAVVDGAISLIGVTSMAAGDIVTTVV